MFAIFNNMREGLFDGIEQSPPRHKNLGDFRQLIEVHGKLFVDGSVNLSQRNPLQEGLPCCWADESSPTTMLPKNGNGACKPCVMRGDFKTLPNLILLKGGLATK